MWRTVPTEFNFWSTTNIELNLKTNPIIYKAPLVVPPRN